MSKQFARALSLCLIVALTVGAQSPSVADVYAQIRAEETNNSKIMWIIHHIADVHGPRVTGSPALKSASHWAVKTLTSWGLVNAHLEPWTFQPPSAAKPVPGWENVALAADAVKPFRGQLMVKPLAWTPSTKGVVIANVVMLTPPGLARPGGGGFGGAAARAADAGRAGGHTAAAAHPRGARRVPEFHEGQGSRTNRDGRQSCEGADQLCARAAASPRRDVEGAVRSECSRAGRRAIRRRRRPRASAAIGRWANDTATGRSCGGPVPSGQRRAGAHQRLRPRLRHHHRAAVQHLRLDARGADAGDAQ